MTDNTLMAGIPDREFIRGEVPMTKEEVRVISLSKLWLRDNDVVLDIGAGTGSVSVEIARVLPRSTVFAVEQRKEALELIGLNVTKFGTTNVEIVEGKAPQVLMPSWRANKVFVGGSGGCLRDIIRWVEVHTASGARVVVNAVTLQTLLEAQECLSVPAFEQTEVIQVSVNRIERIGDADMFRPQSPVFIVSATRT